MVDEPFEPAPCLVLIFDDHGAIIEVNQNLADLLGHSRESLAKAHLNTILTPGSKIFYQTHFFPLLKLHERAEEIQLSLLSSTGAEVPVLLSAVRMQRAGKFFNYCSVLPFSRRQRYEEEILEAKRRAEAVVANNEELIRSKRELELNARQLDRQLVALNRSRNELARVSQILSHDLREPIRKIAWFADLLWEENASQEPGSTEVWLEKIRDSCGIADRLLHSLRDFVTLELEEEPPEQVDLTELVGERLQAEIERAAGNLETDLEELPTVRAVVAQLRFVFSCLLKYGLRHAGVSESRRISVRGEIVELNSFMIVPDRYRYEPFARIRVSFSWGFAEGSLTDDLFEPLANLRRDGEDFCLALCGKVIASHRGSISVSTRGSDEATFTIVLPQEHQLRDAEPDTD